MHDGEFTALCEREFSRIVGALTLWCGDRPVAEEVTSEAFARAYRDWQRVRQLDAPGAWVRRVAMNLARSSFRRRQAEWRANRRAHAGTVDRHRDPDGADIVAVRDALQRLAADQRTVLVLRHYLEMSVAEVAETMGRSPTAVTSLAHRAAAALADELMTSPPAARPAGGVS
jgi:RNA polymerase sigma-70 factor (ECF subfamily)